MLYPKGNEEWLIRYLRPCKYYPESARDLVRFKLLKSKQIMTLDFIIEPDQALLLLQG